MPCTKIYILDQVKCIARDLNLDPYSVNYIFRRLHFEGGKFLTTTLPALSKAVVRSLEKGYFDRPTNFAWSGRSLLFCKSLLVQIFDSHGNLLQDDHERVANAVKSIRQLCEYLYKLATSFSKRELAAAMLKYLDKERANREQKISAEWLTLLRKNFETYYSFAKITAQECYSMNRPRNTSGAFARSDRDVLPFYVQKYLPAHVYGNCPRSLRGYSGFFKAYPSSKEGISYSYGPRVCEVLFVPKDSRGPRVISKEPLNLLRAQMSFFDTAIKLLSKDTKGRIEFKSQEKFRELALQGSLDRSWATLDLKDASDSVLTRVIRAIGRNSPLLRHVLSHLRSTHAKLPNGGLLRLEKLAGMGSGLTFPIMALLIHLSIATNICRVKRVSFEKAMEMVYVYGDDVIVPRDCYDVATEALNLSGLEQNLDKSFNEGYFRESCGGDYYRGHDVTPKRLRFPNASLSEISAYSAGLVTAPLKGRRKGLQKANSPMVLHELGTLELERHCRELFHSPLWTLREYYYSKLESKGSLGPLPYVGSTSPVLGRLDHAMVTTYDENAYVPLPVMEDYSDSVCDTKGLGMALSKTHSPSCYPFEFGQLIGTDVVSQAQFGVFAKPRVVKLKRRKVGILDKL